MKEMIQEQRLKLLNNNDFQNGDYVLYWMQASQRTEYNHALEYAIERANKLNRPLLVYFNIIPNFPNANERSYSFMLQGLREVSKSLEARNIEFLVKIGQPTEEVRKLSKESSLIIMNQDYQRMQRHWRTQIAVSVKCPVIQVETNVIVPVELAYKKEAYSAGILRPKLQRKLEQFLQPLSERSLDKTSNSVQESVNLNEIPKVLELLAVDGSVTKVKHISRGTSESKEMLSEFINHRLSEFPLFRNDPSKDYVSNMSPYLHFGQISPLFIALEIMKSKSVGTAAYLEELII
jgi:deoxyribodipyrimidine photo-lyase